MKGYLVALTATLLAATSVRAQPDPNAPPLQVYPSSTLRFLPPVGTTGNTVLVQLLPTNPIFPPRAAESTQLGGDGWFSYGTDCYFVGTGSVRVANPATPTVILLEIPISCEDLDPQMLGGSLQGATTGPPAPPGLFGLLVGFTNITSTTFASSGSGEDRDQNGNVVGTQTVSIDRNTETTQEIVGQEMCTTQVVTGEDCCHGTGTLSCKNTCTSLNSTAAPTCTPFTTPTSRVPVTLLRSLESPGNPASTRTQNVTADWTFPTLQPNVLIQQIKARYTRVGSQTIGMTGTPPSFPMHIGAVSAEPNLVNPFSPQTGNPMCNGSPLPGFGYLEWLLPINAIGNSVTTTISPTPECSSGGATSSAIFGGEFGIFTDSYPFSLAPRNSELAPSNRRFNNLNRHGLSRTALVATLSDVPAGPYEVTITVDDLEVDQSGHAHGEPADSYSGYFIDPSTGDEASPPRQITCEIVSTGPGNTDSCEIDFQADEVAGLVRFSATVDVGLNQLEANATLPIRIAPLTNLQSVALKGHGTLSRAEEDPVKHADADAFFVNPGVLASIQKLLSKYNEITVDSNYPQGLALRLNDGSLRWGGLFDVAGNYSWSPDGHKGHRAGEAIDIRLQARDPITQALVTTNRRQVESACLFASGELVDEGNSRLHCQWLRTLVAVNPD